MKKIVLILSILSVMIITGCEDNRIPEQKQQSLDANIAAHIIEFNYKGHRYLKYDDGKGYCSVGGITHDPNCPCHNVKQDTIDNE